MPASTERPTPRVSVVIPCYNAADFLAETVDSVLAQTFDSFEVIIADDGSTDASTEVAERLIAEHPDRSITLLRLPPSGHPSNPRNAGIEVARGDLILCLDADDVLTPTFLEYCVTALDANPAASIAYTDQEDFGANERRHTVPEYDFIELTRKNFIGPATMFRRQAWVDAGGYDPDIRYEDWDLWITAGMHGHFGIKVHGTHFRYRVRTDGRFLTGGIPRDRRTKAQFVLKRPHLYTPEQHRWASGVLAGDPGALSIQDDLWAIPQFAPAPVDPAAAGAAPTGAHHQQSPSAQPAFISVLPSTPLVSVVMPAYNLSRYLPAAIDSALAQRGVHGEIEVIVVDDGSTDDTPSVLAAYGDRIRTVRQPNGGLVAAVDTGLGLVRGDFVALLDADDEWPAHRLSSHLAALERNPLLGLVHGDLEIIDADGTQTHPSFFERERMQIHDGRPLGALLAGNFVTQSAVTLRASLLPALHPIAPQAGYPDWWLAACAAAVAEIGRVPGVAARYRQHGANMCLGTDFTDQPRIQRRELPWRRWMFEHLAGDDAVNVRDLYVALKTWSAGLTVAASGEPRGTAALLERDRIGAARELASLPLPGPGGARSRALLRALAHDPFDAATQIDLELALEREFQLRRPEPSPPLITLSTRSQLTLAWLDEVLSSPSLPAAWAQEWNDADRSLVILAPFEANLARLSELVESDPLLSSGGCDLTVITEPATTPARNLLAARADALLSCRPAPAPYDTLAVDPAIERSTRSAAA